MRTTNRQDRETMRRIRSENASRAEYTVKMDRLAKQAKRERLERLLRERLEIRKTAPNGNSEAVK